MKKIVWLLLFTFVLACSKDEDTGTPGNTQPIDPGIVADTFSIGFENRYEPFVGLITRNTCGICGQSGHPLFDGYLSATPQVNGVSFNYASSDPLYHPEARDYVDFVQISGTPNYVFNTQNFSSSLDPWKDAVNQSLSRSALAAMAMDGKMLSQDSVDLTVYIAPNTNFNSSDIQLAIYVLENNVISPQQDYGASPTLVENYVHNHVYRGSVSGVFGEPINGLINSSDTLSIQRSLAIPADADARNVYFMAVLLQVNASGEPTEVIQSQRLNR